MDFVHDGVVNSLARQQKKNIMYKNYSFRYVIIIINQQYFAIIYIYPFK